MEVYPNSTTMMALTTLAVTVDWQVQSAKSEDVKDSKGDSYQQAFSIETASIGSHDMEVALQHPDRAMLSYDAAKEISEILEKTFCA